MSSKKKKTTETTQQVTTPTNPAWVDPQIQGLTGQITNLAGQDPSQFVAPTNGLLTQAGQTAGALTSPDLSSSKNLFQSLMNTGAQQVTPTTGTSASLLDNLSAYMSPYTDNVVNAALNNYDYTAGQTRAQNKLSMANLDDTFGGSGRYITEPLLNSQLDMGRASLDAGLRDQAFNTGANLSNLDAGRRQDMSLANMAAQNNASLSNATLYEQALARQQQAGQSLANTALSGNQAALDNLNAQSGIGALLQQLQQQQAEAPLSVLGSLTGMYGNMTNPLGLLHGQTTNGTGTSTTKTSGGLLGDLGKVALGIGSIVAAPATGGASLAAGGAALR